MINYIEKGEGLQEELIRQGLALSKVDGAWIYRQDDETAIQLIINNYDPLPAAQAEASKAVNDAVGIVRLKYATDIPYQSDSYKAKLADCEKFKADGYPEQAISNYIYVNARATRQGVTGQVAADEIIGIADQWNFLLFTIENMRDEANEAIAAETDWQQCKVIADQYIAQLENI